MEKDKEKVEKPNRKRKAYYNSTHPNKKPRGGAMTVGMKGFLCTCNGKTRDCTREAYNILNEHWYRLHPKEEKVSEENEEESACEIDTELKKEVEALKDKRVEHKFQYCDPGVNGCAFIKTTVEEDPVVFVHGIMKHIEKEKQQKTRYLLRMVPVQAVCKAYLDDIKRTAEKMFDAPFRSEPTTYAIVINRRSNDTLLREELIESLAQIIKDKNLSHKADLKSPKLTVLVEVMRSLCCLSVVPEFQSLKKYNLVQIANSK